MQSYNRSDGLYSNVQLYVEHIAKSLCEIKLLSYDPNMIENMLWFVNKDFLKNGTYQKELVGT